MKQGLCLVLFLFHLLSGAISVANVNNLNQNVGHQPLPVLQAISSTTTGLGTGSNSSPQYAQHERKNNDLKVEESKYGEPAPEYYRGTSAYDRDRYQDRYGVYRPSTSISHKYGGDRGDFFTSNGIYDSRLPTSSYGTTTTSHNSYGYGLNKDRLNTLYGQTGAGDGNGYYQQGGVYDGVNRPPYGPPQVVEIPGYQNNWNSNTGGVAYTTYDNGVYDYGHGGYGHSSIFGGKQAISKSLLIPLAGAALLGVAAALVANPVLLQLGTVTGKRKRRDLTGNGQELAYKGYKK